MRGIFGFVFLKKQDISHFSTKFKTLNHIVLTYQRHNSRFHMSENIADDIIILMTHMLIAHVEKSM